MRHLTDGQFEQRLQGDYVESGHLNECRKCQAVLAEKKALAKRLRLAFFDVKPTPDFVRRIHEEFITLAGSIRKLNRKRIWIRDHWSNSIMFVAAVAAVLMLALMMSVSLDPSSASAAQAELVEIHTHNLSEGHDFVAESDPKNLAKYFREQLGFDPRLPQPKSGLSLRGCCIDHFKGDVVGSYVVDTMQEIISIVIVRDEPVSLGMSEIAVENGHMFYETHYALCNMVSVRIEGNTYCAVGQVSQAYLKDLLAQLLPNGVSNQK